jgi:membrane fusion protein (multidrug efflux system)
MFVRARIIEGVAHNAVLAPQQGVTRDPKGNATALIVNSQGHVEQRPLEIARAVGDSWLVTSGLHGGDRVIVEGIQKVRPGMPVRAVPATVPQTATGQVALNQSRARQPSNQGSARQTRTPQGNPSGQQARPVPPARD